MSEPKRRRNRRSGRPWIIPPGLLSQNEPFEGYAVLDELRNELGVILWQALRDVELWATASPSVRPSLFSPGCLRQRMERIDAELDPEAPERALLEALSTLLNRPGEVRGVEVSELCEEIARWASDTGRPRTALSFAQRAALAAPEEAGPAYLVGVVARRMADYRRSETWFRRALALGRRNRDWRNYGMAHIGIANLYMQRGDGPRARTRLLRALRAARRYGIWPVRSLALHDLFIITATGDDAKLAEHYARSAFRSYGRRHPRLPALAHDIARFWMTHGQFEVAVVTFQAVLPHFSRVPDRMLGLSNLAQAAGGAGDKPTFIRAWNEVWQIIDDGQDTERVAEALINLAYGAAALGEIVRMDMAASYAVTVATRRQEARERLVAEQLLDAARRMRPGDARELQAPHEYSRSSNALAEQLVEALMETVDR